MGFRVIVRSATRQRLGVLPFLSLQMQPVDNGVGTWQISVDANDPKAGLLQPGTGIIVLPDDADLDSDPDFSGQMTSLPRQADEDGRRTLVVSGLDDNLWLQDRNCYPDPSRTFEQQTIVVEADASPYDTRSGAGETVIKQLVNLNAGPGAVTARRVPGLTIETDLARGASVDSSARFDVLTDQIRNLATTAGLSWRVLQVGAGLVFTVWVPRDRTAQARFSRRLGNLGAYSYTIEGPKVTASLVAGSGTLEARALVERVNAAAETDWGRRVESFLDQSSTDVAAELEQAGDRNNADNGPTGSLSMAPRDIPALRYGRDYTLGDLVTVEVDGTDVVDRVRSVTITDGPDGTSTAPLVGSGGATTDDAIVRRIRDNTRRLDALETGR